MTTNSHLNNFVELDSKILEEHSKIAEELLEVEHLDSDNTRYLAKLLFILKRYDESAEQLERILSLKSDDAQAMAFIGINFFRKADYETALAYFKRSLEKDPDNETALLYKMISHESLNDYNAAVECGEQILEKDSRNTSLINRLIDYHFELKNYDACLDYIARTKYDDHYKKALILYESGRYEECIEEAGKIRTAESYRLAGRSYQKLGNAAKAAKYLYKAYEKDLNIDTLLEIGEIYFEVRDYVRSIHYLKSVLIHDERNAEAYNLIARAHLKSSNWHDAIEYAQKALEISKKMPETYITLAEAYFQTEANPEKTLQVIDEGINENPDSAKLWAKKGEYNFTHDQFTFRQSYEKALSLNPCNFDIYEAYIFLLLLDGDDERAKKFYNEMLLYNPIFEKSFDELKSMFI